MNNNHFYTYVYLDPTKPGNYSYDEFIFDHEPFYIGKGHNNQLLSHLRSAKRNKLYSNKHKYNRIKKILNDGYTPIIIKFENNLSEQKSFEYEIQLITTIGRRDLNTGFLTNMTDGGEGFLNVNRDHMRGDNNPAKKLSVRKKISKALKGVPKPHMLGDKNPMKRKEVVAKIMGDNNPMRKDPSRAKRAADKNRGQKRPSVSGNNSCMRNPEIALKNANARRGTHIGGKLYKVVEPNGHIIQITNLKKFCFDNDLKYDNMLYSTYPTTSKDYTHKGWKCQPV